MQKKYPIEELYFLNALGAHFDLDKTYAISDLQEIINENDIKSILYIVDINCNYYQKVFDKEKILKSAAFEAIVDKIINN